MSDPMDEVERLRAELAEARANNLRSFCVYCGLEQMHPSLVARLPAMVEHTVHCEQRPEMVLFEMVEALEAALAANAKNIRRAGNDTAELCWCQERVRFSEERYHSIPCAQARAILARVEPKETNDA